MRHLIIRRGILKKESWQGGELIGQVHGRKLFFILSNFAMLRYILNMFIEVSLRLISLKFGYSRLSRFIGDIHFLFRFLHAFIILNRSHHTHTDTHEIAFMIPLPNYIVEERSFDP